MPIPAFITAGAAGAKAAGGLSKLLGLLKAAYTSKNFWKYGLTGAYLGQTAIGVGEGMGERGLTREQLALQKLLATSGVAASKMETERAERKSKEYTDLLLKSRAEDRAAEREQNMMAMFQQQQERQMAMILQAMQVASQRPSAAARPAGTLGLMRSNF